MSLSVFVNFRNLLRCLKPLASLRVQSPDNFDSRRLICSSSLLRLCAGKDPRDKAFVTVTFKMANNEEYTVQGKEGDSLLDVVINKHIPADGYGACEGTLACSTCHVVLSKEDYAKLPDKPSDEEMDMLDLAYGLCDTSRLGCQIILSKKLDGLVVKIPECTSDARNLDVSTKTKS